MLAHTGNRTYPWLLLLRVELEVGFGFEPNFLLYRIRTILPDFSPMSAFLVLMICYT